MFNGDTAAGRAQWVPWLRSLELELDEWAWAVLQADVPSHGEVAKIMKKTPASRTADEYAELKTLIEAAAGLTFAAGDGFRSVEEGAC